MFTRCHILFFCAFATCCALAFVGCSNTGSIIVGEAPSSQNNSSSSTSPIPPLPPPPPTTTTTIPEPVSVTWPVAGQVALTFDDGPLPQYTTPLLDYLRAAGVPATFFVLGRSAAEWPDLIRRMHEEKHSVQNHTWDHPYLWNLSDDGMRGQVGQLDDLIFSLTGSTPSCVRPPYGATNQRVEAVLSEIGKTTIMWNSDSQDWRGGTPEEIAFRAIISASSEKPEEGVVVVLHDGGGDRSTTIEATKLIVEHYKTLGFQFVVLCR